jgi:hypothetical protein
VALTSTYFAVFSSREYSLNTLVVKTHNNFNPNTKGQLKAAVICNTRVTAVILNEIYIFNIYISWREQQAIQKSG